jgi:hypothetical protein
MTLQLLTTAQINANASPVVNTVSTLMTGMAAFMTANTSRTSATAPTAEANLTITVNETGVYKLDAFFSIASQNANGAGGFFANLHFGSAVGTFVGGGNFGAGGVANTQEIAIPYAATLANYAGFGFGDTGHVISAVTTRTDWVTLHGVLTITTTGTVIPGWSQNFSSANATLLLANSYVMLTKIG